MPVAQSLATTFRRTLSARVAPTYIRTAGGDSGAEGRWVTATGGVHAAGGAVWEAGANSLGSSAAGDGVSGVEERPGRGEEMKDLEQACHANSSRWRDMGWKCLYQQRYSLHVAQYGL
jgi:hypothetical protein